MFYRVVLAAVFLSIFPQPGHSCESALLCLAFTNISGIPHLLRDNQAPLSHTTLRIPLWLFGSNRPVGIVRSLQLAVG